MSATAPQLKSINCTECGAPLELHGGRQVKSICCPYCGSVLDKREDYKVVEHFLSAERPFSPLKMGQQGVLNEVKLTIIGMVEYKTADDSWLEYQLFSPTHGYSWLSYEGGHFVFGHKVRYYPETYAKEWKSELSVNNKKYKVFSQYAARISFVEGELTWVARKNDKVEALEAIAPPFIYSIEKTRREEEYSLGEYIAAETVYQTFGVTDPPPKPTWVHPAQPYSQGRGVDSFTKISKIFAPLYLVIYLLISVFSDPAIVLRKQISVEQYKKGFVSKPFTIKNADRTLKIKLYSTLVNSWAFFDIKIKKNNTELVHSVGKEMYLYEKNLEQVGAQEASLYFNVPAEGNYTVSIKGVGDKALRPLFVEIQAGTIEHQYFLSLLGGTFFFGWVWPFFGQWLLGKKRWREGE